MKLIPIDIEPKLAKVISIREAHSKYQPGKCQHKQLIVDDVLDTVECGDCGAKLNPVNMLLRFAREESLWAQRAVELKKLVALHDAKIRCKCQHCGKMTHVKV